MSKGETPLTDAFYWCHRSQRESLDFAGDLERKLEEARTALEHVRRHHEAWDEDPDCNCDDCVFLRPVYEALARIDAGNACLSHGEGEKRP